MGNFAIMQNILDKCKTDRVKILVWLKQKSAVRVRAQDGSVEMCSARGHLVRAFWNLQLAYLLNF